MRQYSPPTTSALMDKMHAAYIENSGDSGVVCALTVNSSSEDTPTVTQAQSTRHTAPLAEMASTSATSASVGMA